MEYMTKSKLTNRKRNKILRDINDKVVKTLKRGKSKEEKKNITETIKEAVNQARCDVLTEAYNIAKALPGGAVVYWSTIAIGNTIRKLLGRGDIYDKCPKLKKLK